MATAGQPYFTCGTSLSNCYLCALLEAKQLSTEQSHISDPILFLQIAEGNEGAFTQLYSRYAPPLARFTDSLIKSSAISDEIVQETFLRIWMSRDKLPAVQTPQAWIYKIASNICYTHLRRTLMQKQIMEKLLTENSEVQHDQIEAIQVKGLLMAVQEAVLQLPPQRQTIYRLSREQGLSASEIASALSLSIQTVRNTLTSSLVQLRTFLAQKGYPIAMAGLLLLLTEKNSFISIGIEWLFNGLN